MNDAVPTTVLVVDDDEDIRVLVRLKLELAGDIEVVAEAVDGLEALEAFERLGAPPVPQVVVLDNRMPGMTGVEVATHLRQRVPDQRIILFSAYLDDETRARARGIGVSEIVSKEDLGDLANIVRRVRLG